MKPSKDEAQGNLQQEINAIDGSLIQHVFQTSVDSPLDRIHIGPTYTHSKEEQLNHHLEKAVAFYKGRLFQAVAQVSHPSHPYKLLSSFRIEDTSIFHGRSRATKDLCKKAFQSRLLVLHAKSGAGKTSLLNAGLFPHIIRQGRLPLYIHTYDKDPILLIKQALVPATLGLWPDGLHELSLYEFLAHICTCLKRDNVEELFIVLDQFEDFFLYQTQISERREFIKALGECYSDQTLPIRIIISLRKDYYSDLIEFEHILPHLHIFQNHYRPDIMTQQEMKEAIIQPLKALNSDVTYDPALLTTLLAELSDNEIELPLLQIVCTRLYETLKENKKRITMQMYEDLGRTEGVLKNYLNEVLSGFPEQEKNLAKSILKYFIRFDLTSQALSYNMLIDKLKEHKNELDHVLIQLINARLLRRDDIEGETKYELVHEYLVTEIAKWIDTADMEFKRAEELLKSELANWYSYDHLISLERLELLYPYRTRFKGLEAEDWECILRSAIEANDQVGDEYIGASVINWVKVVNDINDTFLIESIIWPLIEDLQNGEESWWVRSQAAAGLAKVAKYAVHPVEPLFSALQSALQDEHFWVRYNSAEALGELGDLRAVEPLLASLQDKHEYVRSSAAQALGELGDLRAADPLLNSLQNENWGAASALGKLKVSRAFNPLIMALKSNNNTLRRWAAWGLGELGDTRAVEPLLVSLQNEHDMDHPGQIKALGQLGDVRAVEPLIVLLQHKHSSVREQAAEALGIIGDPQAIKPLTAALQDGSSNVSESARSSLENIYSKLKKDKTDE